MKSVDEVRRDTTTKTQTRHLGSDILNILTAAQTLCGSVYVKTCQLIALILILHIVHHV